MTATAAFHEQHHQAKQRGNDKCGRKHGHDFLEGTLELKLRPREDKVQIDARRRWGTIALVPLEPPMIRTAAAVLAIVAGLWTTACTTGPVPVSQPRILTQEPPYGALRPDETVLVDDGVCPAGQVKQVVGGSSRVYGTNTPRAGTNRQVSCIPRPQ